MLPILNFPVLVQRMTTAAQGACSALLDLTVGSVLRAVLEAVGGVALWLQWLILLVLQRTRAATSVGNDLDTFVADFGLTRLPGTAATGAVTFSRYTAGQQALVQPGVTVRTSDLLQTFVVVTDTTNSAWSPSLAGYVIPATALSVTVPVQAVTVGSGGNVQVGSISLPGSAIPGVDTVANSLPFTNGLDAESDAALRARFVNYITSRSRATPGAVAYAVQSVQQGLSYSIQENVDTTGATRLGNFVVVVDDGTGTPSASLLATVQVAVDAVRPISSTFAVIAPQDVLANVSLILTVLPTADRAVVVPLVQDAIVGLIDALGVGQPLLFGRLFAAVYGVSPYVADVEALTLNGGTANIGGGIGQVVRPGTLAID